MVRSEDQVPIDYALSVKQVFYAALQKVLESRESKVYSDDSIRYGDECLLKNTFDLLSTSMGFSAYEKQVARSLITLAPKMRHRLSASHAPPQFDL